jgi:sugar lactone lactonase YvrE
MKLGISEILLLLAISLILFGPTVIPRIQRWYRRAGARQMRAERRRENRRAQVRQARDELLNRFGIAAGILLIGGALFYGASLLFGPVDYAPQPFTANAYCAPKSAAVDSALKTLDISPYKNPVCVAQQDGWLYMAVEKGIVIRVRPDGTGLTEVFSTGGDVTSLCFAPDGTLYLTDAAQTYTAGEGGAVMKASFDGWAVTIEPVVTGIAGRRLNSPCALAAAPDGKLYFAEFSQVNAAAQGGMKQAFYTELLAHTGTGAVYVYDPADGSTALVADGFQGAGGLALDAEGKTLYISETNQYRVWSLPADSRGAKPESSGKIVLDGLNGYAAGLSAQEDGTIWAAVSGNRIGWIDSAAENPFLRRIAMRLPQMTQAWLLTPKSSSVRAYAIDGNGTLLRTADAAVAGGGRATGVCVTEDGCWLANADGSVLYCVRPR